jgi:hypothetical protein
MPTICQARILNHSRRQHYRQDNLFSLCPNTHIATVGGKLRQDKNPHKVHQSAKRDLTAKQQDQRHNSKA